MRVNLFVNFFYLVVSTGFEPVFLLLLEGISVYQFRHLTVYATDYLPVAKNLNDTRVGFSCFARYSALRSPCRIACATVAVLPPVLASLLI